MMVFGEVFQRFVESAPTCVMYRALMENIFAPEKLDAVFAQAAEAQYERELLFSSLVDLASLVVCRVSATVRSAYLARRERIPVSLQAVYDKLQGVEPVTSRALVRHVASQAAELIDRCKGLRRSLLPGYRVRILDGNHLGKTQHRLKVLRNTAAAPLPGQALVLLDPQRMVIDDVVPCENGHSQERSLLDQVLAAMQPRDLLIDDRNFCTLGFLFGLKDRNAFFITRQHGNMPWKSLQKPKYVGRCDTGRVYEQQVELRNPQTGRTTQLRRITVKLKSPTRDGDMEIHLLTNLPAKVKAVKVAELYRKRWTIEQAFNELTMHLRCELNTLGYPKAALFAFCVAVCGYNLLAAVKGALRGMHGEEKLEKEVSNFYLTNEISTVYGGMMVALPPVEWEPIRTLSLAQFAALLRRWAKQADLRRYPKTSRGPKKPKPKLRKTCQHIATSELLENQRPRETNNRQSPAVPDH